MKKSKRLLTSIGIILLGLLMVIGQPEIVQAKTKIARPKIKTQPKSVSVLVGKKAVFKVKATGKRLKYQWYYKKPGTTVWKKVSSGGKKATYRVKATAARDGYQYKCVVKNKAGKVESNVVRLTVRSKNGPEISDPVSPEVQILRKRVDQMVRISAVTQATLPNQKGDIAKGTTLNGVIYSSSRAESLFVPDCVSFDTYMTALQNPNSYIYTRISTTPNSKTFYGSVCSSFICYCYGLNAGYTTHDLGDCGAFYLSEHQDVDHLKTGDLLLKKDKHVMMVYDIKRNSKGTVTKITIAHQATPTARTFTVGRKWLSERLGVNKYRIYKFKNWDQLTYTPSQWVSAGNEGTKTPKWNQNLGPRRGDRANWPVGETIEIDILNRENYTQALLYRVDTLISTTDITGISCLSYEGLKEGGYRVCLTDGTRNSDFCYFNIVSSTVSAEDLGNGRVKITFHSDWGTPSWFAWCGSSGSSRMGAVRSYVLTEEDIANGYVISTYQAGSWLFKVEFKNKYGTFCSKFVAAEIS